MNGTGFGFLVLRHTQRERDKAITSFGNIYEQSEATRAAKAKACCKRDLNTCQEDV